MKAIKKIKSVLTVNLLIILGLFVCAPLAGAAVGGNEITREGWRVGNSGSYQSYTYTNGYM